MSTGTPLLVIQATTARVPDGEKRRELEAKARLLARFGLAWHLVEAAVAVAAGVIAASTALIGFGADSLIEFAAGAVVLWLMSGGRATNHRLERRAQKLIAISFILLAVYVFAEGGRDLIGGNHPSTSWAGIVLSIVTLATMPPLALAKRRVGVALGSSATTSESQQTMLCAYLSGGLLVGLLANALVGWWWADSVVALAIGVVAFYEARSAWLGNTCDCC